MKGLLTLVLLSLLVLRVSGQLNLSLLNGAQLNTIETAVPFLTIAPDARSAGMGDVGAASAPDGNSQHWNVAKYAFMGGNGAFAFTYTPWLRNLVPGIYLAYGSAYYKLNAKNVLSTSFRYFDLGELNLFNVPGEFQPFELAVDAGFSRRFSENLSGGIAFRYIHSDLASGGVAPGGQEIEPGTSIAGDLGFYYQRIFLMREKEAQWALGFSLNNVGSKISYTEDAEGTPIPTILRLGGRFQFPVSQGHSLSVMADINKLLVPTPPVYDTDASGNHVILRGKAPPSSVLAGMLQSFYDAPGVMTKEGSYSVFREEMYEIMYSTGLEYRFKNLLAFRTGYSHEHSAKGNRKYFTLGAGVHYHLFSMDLSYLFPSNGQNSPLANTIRVMITIDFGRS